jgi:hypothetical protein
MRRTAWYCAWGFGLFIGVIATLVPACASHVLLHRRPDAETGTLGPLIHCEVGDKPCEVDSRYDGSIFNLSGTTKFSLPNCTYGIREILIRDVGSSGTDVIVRCAAPAPTPDAGLPTTAPDGGTYFPSEPASPAPAARPHSLDPTLDHR